MIPKKLTIHPFLAALYPILFLYAHNIDEVFFSVLWLPLVFSLSIALLIFFFFFYITKSAPKAGIITTLIGVLFYSFGPLSDIISVPLFRGEIFLIVLTVLLFVLASWRSTLSVSRTADEASVKSLAIYLFVLSGLFFWHILTSYFICAGFSFLRIGILALMIILWGIGFIVLIKINTERIKYLFPNLHLFLQMSLIVMLL